MIFVFTFLAMALTYAMFAMRQVMLGFPSAIFWAILGAYSYTLSAATWDIYYFLFFASLFMAIFSMLAMYALRSKDIEGPDADEGEYIDEERSDGTKYMDEEDKSTLDPRLEDDGDSTVSKRTAAIRSRAKKRRENAGRKAKWSEFR